MCNVGGIDRVLRIIVGLALISLVFVGPQVVWGWIGVITSYSIHYTKLYEESEESSGDQEQESEKSSGDQEQESEGSSGDQEQESEKSSGDQEQESEKSSGDQGEESEESSGDQDKDSEGQSRNNFV